MNLGHSAVAEPSGTGGRLCTPPVCWDPSSSPGMITRSGIGATLHRFHELGNLSEVKLPDRDLGGVDDLIGCPSHDGPSFLGDAEAVLEQLTDVASDAEGVAPDRGSDPAVLEAVGSCAFRGAESTGSEALRR